MKPLTDRDPGDETLFDPATTLPPKCTCGQTRKNLCPIDAAITNGGLDKWARRPRTCLTRHDPAKGDIPF
jgi:hypothetical protein